MAGSVEGKGTPGVQEFGNGALPPVVSDGDKANNAGLVARTAGTAQVADDPKPLVQRVAAQLPHQDDDRVIIGRTAGEKPRVTVPRADNGHKQINQAPQPYDVQQEATVAEQPRTPAEINEEDADDIEHEINQVIDALFSDVRPEGLQFTYRSARAYRSRFGLEIISPEPDATVLDIGTGNARISAETVGLQPGNLTRADLFPQQERVDEANVLKLPYGPQTFGEVWNSFGVRQVDYDLPESVVTKFYQAIDASDIKAETPRDYENLFQNLNTFLGLRALCEMLRVTEDNGRVRLVSFKEDFTESGAVRSLLRGHLEGKIPGLRPNATEVTHLEEAWCSPKDANFFLEKTDGYDQRAVETYVQGEYRKLIPREVARAIIDSERVTVKFEAQNSDSVEAGVEREALPTYQAVERRLRGGTEDVTIHAENLPSVLGHFSDGRHVLGRVSFEGNMLIYNGREIDVTFLEDEIAPERLMYLETNRRVIDKAHEAHPNIQRVFAPFNGAETTGLESEYTIATDRLPIGTPQQVEQLYENPFARAMYLVDKLDRGHSYSGILQEIGYLGAALRWDIEDIQRGKISSIQYLNSNGEELDRQTFDENGISPTGIKIIYETPDGKTRIHEQYTDVPDQVQSQLVHGTFDALYLRATENLVTKRQFFPDYQLYLAGVKPGGVVVSDSKIEDLTWNMDGAFSHREIVELDDYEDFGYAGRSAKIAAAKPELAFQGHVNILTKSPEAGARVQKKISPAPSDTILIGEGLESTALHPTLTDAERERLEQNRFVMTQKSHEGLVRLRTAFHELQERYSHLRGGGLGFFGSRKTATERADSDYDVVIFYYPTKMTVEESGLLDSSRHWNEVVDTLEQALDGPRIERRVRAHPKERPIELRIDISEAKTQEELDIFIERAGHFINQDINEYTLPSGLAIPSTYNLVRRFLLTDSSNVINNRKYILDRLRVTPDGDEYLKLLMAKLSVVERGLQKVRLPLYKGYPRTIDEAEEYFLTTSNSTVAAGAETGAESAVRSIVIESGFVSAWQKSHTAIKNQIKNYPSPDGTMQVEDVWLGSIYNSDIKDYDKTFAGVLRQWMNAHLPDGESTRLALGESIVNLIQGIKGAVVVDVLAPSGTLASMFEKLPEDPDRFGIAVSNTDERRDGERDRDRRLRIEQIPGDITTSKTLRDLEAKLDGRYVNIFLERGIGALWDLPAHPQYYRYIGQWIWNKLSPDNGFMLIELPPDRLFQQNGLQVPNWTEILDYNGVEYYIHTSSTKGPKKRTLFAIKTTDKPLKFPGSRE